MTTFQFCLRMAGITAAALWPGLAHAVDSASLDRTFVAPQETVTVNVRSRTGKVRWRLEDETGTAVGAGRGTVRNGGATLTVPVSEPGWFEIVVSDGMGDKRLPIASMSAYDETDKRFGVMTHFSHGWTTRLIPTLRTLGVRTIRDEIYWSSFERQPGRYQPEPRYRHFMSALKAADIDPLIVLSFANPNYDGGQTPFTDAGRQAFATYATKLVEAFRDQISAVEVWNEYNGGFCSGPCALNRAFFYTAMLRDTQAALKSAHPDVTVAGIASDHVPLPYFEELARQDAFKSLDVVTLHPYRKIEEGVLEDLEAVRRIVGSTGVDKPIWATEYGVINAPPMVTADYLVRMTTLLLAGGVERMYWYLLQDTGDFPTMGLLSEGIQPGGTFAPKPAFAAYGNLIRHLSGARYERRLAMDPRTHVHRFQRDGRTVDVAWSLSGTSRLALGAGATAFNALGRPLPLGTNGSSATLDVTQDPVVIVNGGNIGEARDDRFLAGSFSHMAPSGGEGLVAGFRALKGGGETLDLQRLSTRWSYYMGSTTVPALSISDTSMRPGTQGGDQMVPFRRWTSTVDGKIRVRGYVEKPQAGGDGLTARLTQNGKAVFEKTFSKGEGAGRKDFERILTVSRGDRLEMSVTATASLDFSDMTNVFYISSLAD